MHKAIIAKIDSTMPIKGADFIHAAVVLGETVIVSKDWHEGMVGVFFPEGLQLSHEFCSTNSLYRHSHLNADNEKTGFFDDNRRVRAQPFKKVKSEGYFTHLDSLAVFCKNPAERFQLGDQFDEVDGQELCRKYYSPKTLKAMENAKRNGKKKKAVETPMFHKHMDTDQFKYYVDKIQKGAILSFHAKVHGTSARYSHSKVVRTPDTFLQKVKNALGLFKSESWEYIAGTRNVVLYTGQEEKEGFHGTEEFRFEILEELKPFLEKGMTVYGEIAGYANGSPVMGRHNVETLQDKAYTKKYGKEMVYKYGCIEGTMRFHIYRISMTNEDGIELDFTDAQVHQWCSERGFLSPLEVHPTFIFDGDTESLKKLVEELTERPDVLTEDYIDPSHVSEGIVVRVDYGRQLPKFYKNKSKVFKIMEGIYKEDNVDVEDAN